MWRSFWIGRSLLSGDGTSCVSKGGFFTGFYMVFTGFTMVLYWFSCGLVFLFQPFHVLRFFSMLGL